MGAICLKHLLQKYVLNILNKVNKLAKQRHKTEEVEKGLYLKTFT